MNWDRKEIDIKGDIDFLKELERIIDKHNPPNGDAWRITGHIADILQDLHINAKSYNNLRVYWTNAKFNKNGHLIINELFGNYGERYKTFADILINAFPDKISGINYKLI